MDIQPLDFHKSFKDALKNMRDHLQYELYPSVIYSPFYSYSCLNIPVESLNIFSVSHYTRSTLEVLRIFFSP